MFGRPLNGLIQKGGNDFTLTGTMGWGNAASGAATDVAFNYIFSATNAWEMVVPRACSVVAWSYSWIQGPVQGVLTLTPFTAAAGGTPADPGATYDVSVAATAASQRGYLELTTPLVLAQGASLAGRYSTDANWNVATADIHVQMLLRF